MTNSATEQGVSASSPEPVVDEVGALIATLLATPPTRLTACRGWTAHELVAHLAAGASEEADLIECHLAGKPTRATRTHDARERPFCDLADDVLRDALSSEAIRLAVALDALATRGDEHVMFTGRPMNAADFAMHSRSECALHRWDLVGRDPIGWQMLAQPELTEHAVKVLTDMATLPESPLRRVGNAAGGIDTCLVVRSPDDARDVVVTVCGDAVTMATTPRGDQTPALELDAAARLLLLWGRREPSAPADLFATGHERRIVEAIFGS